MAWSKRRSDGRSVLEQARVGATSVDTEHMVERAVTGSSQPDTDILRCPRQLAIAEVDLELDLVTGAYVDLMLVLGVATRDVGNAN